MIKHRVGDRVAVTGFKSLLNLEGTIVDLGFTSSPLVQFDIDVGGHAGCNRTRVNKNYKDGHCLFVLGSQLKRIAPRLNYND